MNTFGADTEEDVTDWGEVSLEEKRRMLALHERRDAEMMFLAQRITALVTALQNIMEESAPDTPYSWCQTKLSRCHEIAANALRPDETDATNQ